MPLLVHGEVTDHDIDLFDREAVFIERVMRPLRRDFPELKIVFEHITTKDAAEYVAEAEGPIAATITAHHLLYNRNEIFKGGINPHYYCLPVLKREEHRLALVTAATSGDERFFLGTDSAPHAVHAKESSLRLRRLLHGAARDGAVRHRLRAGRRAGQAGSLRQPERPGLLRPAGQRGHDHPEARSLDHPADRGDGRARSWCRSTPASRSAGRCCKRRMLRRSRRSTGRGRGTTRCVRPSTAWRRCGARLHRRLQRQRGPARPAEPPRPADPLRAPGRAAARAPPTKHSSAPPAACPRATTCTTSSMAWCGRPSRSSSAS